MIFPCTQIPENLKFDVYSNVGSSHEFQGTVNHRLNVISDLKQAKEYLKNLPINKATVNHETKLSLNISPAVIDEASLNQNSINDSPSSLSLSHNPYNITANDTQSSILQKFLSLVALGPITKEAISENLINISLPDLNLLCSNYLQNYDRNDTFIQDDVFPNQHNSEKDTDPSHLILKDKSYKDLKPWHWKWYNNFERNLILNNINNALTRLGYLDTHPLRRKIVNEPTDSLPSNDDSKLGGGFLINRKNTPHSGNNLSNNFNTFKRSQTESPKLSDSNVSPVRKLTKSALANESPKLPETARRLNKPALQSPRPSDLHVSPARKLTTKTASTNGSPVKLNTKTSSTNESPVRPKKSHSLSSSSEDDDEFNKSNKKFKSTDDSTSPSSLNDDNSSNDEKNPRPASSQKKLQYYNNLATKFKLNYKQYETLYNSLVNKKVMNIQDRKRKLVKLFEFHSKLSEWKKILWDYHSENDLKKNIMNLSKHKKTAVSKPEPVRTLSNSKIPQKLKPKVSLDY